MDEIKALVFDTKTRYDIILGSDFLYKAGININYVERNISWCGISIPLRDPFKMKDEEYVSMADVISLDIEDAFFGADWLDNYMAQSILDAKYEKTEISDIAAKQMHLNSTQRKTLEDVLTNHKKLFDGTLGVYPHKKCILKLNLMQNPYIYDHTLYRGYIFKRIKKN